METIKGAKVLIAEDNAINQLLVEDFLTRAGLEVVIAGNGKEAVELVEKIRFDLILMDLQMPEMNGFEAVRTILEKQLDNHPPIIAMTADAMAGDREHCLAIGMVDHIAKPIDPKVLFDLLLKWIPPASGRGPSTVESENVLDKTVSLPADLAGIDMALGIERTNGNKNLYITLLNHFIQDHGKDDQIIARAVIKKDIPLAQRTAHTLKSVAGGIGAQALYDSAQKVEAELKKNRLSELAPLMEKLVLDLAQVVKDLEKKIVAPLLNNVEGVRRTPIDMDQLNALLADFQRLAGELDPGMDSAAVRINRLLHLHDSPLKKIGVSLLNYAETLDFKEAIETVEKLKNELDIAESS